MLFQYSAYGQYMLICSLILVGIICYTFKHRENRIKTFLFANSIVTFIYVFAYAVLLFSHTCRPQSSLSLRGICCLCFNIHYYALHLF